jgi:hypothetical protein
MTTLTFDDVMKTYLAAQHVLSNTVEQASKSHATAVADEAVKLAEYRAKTAELEKLELGLTEIAAELAEVRERQSPQNVEAIIMAGVLGSRDDRVSNAGIEATLAARQSYLTRAQSLSHTKLRPLRALAQLRSLAEYRSSVAVVATWAAFVHARAVYDAGQAVRDLEGSAPLFAIGSVSFQLLEKARKAWGESNSAWVGFYNQERQINKDSSR